MEGGFLKNLTQPSTLDPEKHTEKRSAGRAGEHKGRERGQAAQSAPRAQRFLSCVLHALYRPEYRSLRDMAFSKSMANLRLVFLTRSTQSSLRFLFFLRDLCALSDSFFDFEKTMGFGTF
jgi:hypothetical protein